MSSYDCPATPPELPLNSATPPPAQPKIDATNEGNGGVGQSQAPPSAPARPSSPESCAICLGELANKSVTDSCLHGFCFTCLLEWSKVKPECPLCKAKFGSIIHTIKNDEKYERYEIPPRPPPGPDVLTNEDYIDYRSRYVELHFKKP